MPPDVAVPECAGQARVRILLLAVLELLELLALFRWRCAMARTYDLRTTFEARSAVLSVGGPAARDFFFELRACLAIKLVLPFEFF